MAWQNLSPAQALEALEGDPTLKVLDVRTQPEHDSHRIDRAQLLPVQELHLRWEELDQEATYVVTCEHGVRSVMACEFLTQAGFERLYNLAGGMAQWIGDELPFVGRSAS